MRPDPAEMAKEVTETLLGSQAARLTFMGLLGDFQRAHNGQRRKLEDWERSNLEQQLTACLQGALTARREAKGEAA